MTTNLEMVNDDRIIAKCYVELGNVTKEKGKYDESLHYHRRSMEIFERIDDALSVADSHLNIAEIYKAKGELKQAMSEYEKGLALYEDVYMEDSNKNSDSGTDVSLNSSSFSDLQYKKSLSKSDESLLHTTLITTIEKSVSDVSPVIESNNNAISSLNLIDLTTKKLNEFDNVTKSMNDSFICQSENMKGEQRKSLSSSMLFDFQNIDDNDVFLLSSSPRNIDCQRTGETTSDESDILEIALPSVYSHKQEISELTDGLPSPSKITTDTDTNQTITNIERTKIHNNTYQFWYYLANKQILIIVVSIFLTGILCWSLNSISIPLFFSSSSSSSLSFDSFTYRKSHQNNSEDLSKQLRKLLSWRKEQFIALDKDSQQIIEEFLTNSDNRPKMTLEQFQRILDMLELKIILIPQ